RGPASADRRSVGLCITDPLALRYHGHDTDAGDMAHWYGGVATALAQAGWTVGLFTNGSPEDRAYLNRNAADWIAAAAPTRITRIADFATPGDLATFISSCDLMVAHRMHACIAAHSFAVPTILLKWDPKLESFAEIAGRSDYFVDPATITPTALAELAARAEQAGVDRAACTALIDAAAGDVAALARALRAAVAARS
ncbi:MAG: polysaccharide pyruvyl transferase family protein, partial [Sphingomonas sp.]